jgi:hypothetical protein
MNLVLPIYIWPIYRLLNQDIARARAFVRSDDRATPTAATGIRCRILP